MKKVRFLILISFIQLSLVAQNHNFISFNQKTETVDGKAKTKSIIDVYFDKEKNTIAKHVESPIEIISVTNAFGELFIYYPKTNQLSFQQIEASSSKLNLIYYIANNQTDN
jgi:hypothetical protein